MCSAGGVFWSHSIDLGMLMGINLFRIEVILSQIIKIISIVPTKEISLPIEDKIFQQRYASG